MLQRQRARRPADYWIGPVTTAKSRPRHDANTAQRSPEPMKGKPVMPNPTPDPGVDEWVLASAAEVARNVARHGVPITWSEAAERLRRDRKSTRLNSSH